MAFLIQTKFPPLVTFFNSVLSLLHCEMVDHLLKRSEFVNLSTSVEVRPPRRCKLFSNLCSVHDLVVAMNVENVKDILKKLHIKIFHSSSVIIDEENDDGMCLLEHLLNKFRLLEIKDMAVVDCIELILSKTLIKFDCYKNGQLLILMQEYDKREPETVKYAQWLIMLKKNEEFFAHWQTIEIQKVVAICKKNQYDLFKGTFVKGSCIILKFLMRQVDIFDKDLAILITAVYTRKFVRENDYDCYLKCFEYVLSHKRTNINAVDTSGNMALHVVEDKILIKKILEKKPYFGVKNFAGDSALQHVDPETLTWFFNSLIGDSMYDFNIGGDVSSTKEETYMVLDLTPFDSPSSTNSHGCQIQNVYGIETLLVLSRMKHLQSMFKHPLIKVFFELYWTKYKKKMLWDRPAMLGFAIIYIWLVSGRAITSGYFSRSNSFDMVLYEMLILVMHILLLIMVVYMIVYYTFVIYMFFFSKMNEPCISKYRLRSMMLMDVPLLILICTFIFYDGLNVDLNQVLGIGSMILSVQLTISVSFSNQTLGVNLLMLFYVSWTAFKFLGSTFLIVFGFALSFMHLFSNFSVDNDLNRNLTMNNEAFIYMNDTQLEYNMYHLFAGIFKTIVMMTGELDADDLKFRYGSSYIIFVIFIFIVPVIFVNLLNGLAIGDIQMIQEHAEFMYRKAQLMIMYQFCCINMALR